MIKNGKSLLLGFVFRVTLVHVITYVIFGVLFLSVIGLYPEYYSHPAVKAYIRPTNDPLLTYAPLFQIIRGIIVGLGLYPFRRGVVNNKWGWLVLWGVLTALQVIGAPNGTIETLIYTKVPIWFTLLNAPEVIIQMWAFSVWIFIWERRVDKRLNSTF